METSKNSKLCKELQPIAEQLLANGYNIIIFQNEGCDNFFKVVKNGNICSIEFSRYGFDKYTVSSVHKPCKEAGTGFQIYNEEDKPTIEIIDKALETITPTWSHLNRNTCKYCLQHIRSDIKPVQKWKDEKEYLSSSLNQILNPVLIKSFLH